MSYFGDWGNLKRNLDRVRDNIATKKTNARSRNHRPTLISSSAKNRKSLSLVEHRRKDIRRVRLIYLALIILMTIMFYFTL